MAARNSQAPFDNDRWPDDQYERNEQQNFQEPLLGYNRNQNQSGIGQPQNIRVLRESISGGEVDSIKRDILTDLLFDGLILLLIVHYGKETNCGIRIFMWTMVYFSILAVRSLSNLLRIYIVRNFYQYQNHFQILSFIAVDGTFLVWLIYGNVLFYSPKNNCSEDPNSAVLYNMMFILIVIGYFQMIIYGVIICFLPCIFFAIHSQRRGNIINNESVNQIVSSLTKIKFNKNEFTNDNQCSICMLDFGPEDDVTPLACDPKHYYHTLCIEQWIKTGKNSCPLCRKPIKELQ